jgi:sec-independent protein translocase protein TatA
MNTMLAICPLLFGLGWGEILLIALVILLLFGGRKIPELMKGLGKGVKSFKEGMSQVEKEADKIKEEIQQEEPKKEE